MLEYSTVKEMFLAVESFFKQGQKIIDAYEENDFYIIVLNTGVKFKLRTPNEKKRTND